MCHRFTSICLSLLVLAPISAADWKPAAGPLMTRWAKDVSPDKVHPEYPRPQMVREDWHEPQRPLGLRHRARKSRAGPAAEKMRRPDPRPLPGRVGPLRRHEDGRRGQRLWYRRTFKVPQAGPASRAPAPLRRRRLAMRPSGSTASNSASTPGGYDPFTLRHHRRPEDRSGEQELIVGVWDPTDAGRSRAASRSASPTASGTRPPPASGRPSGWSRCRKRTSSALHDHARRRRELPSGHGRLCGVGRRDAT